MTVMFNGIRLCVFDAYGTLLDFNSATEASRALLGEDTQKFSALWRAKQLEYTWLRAIMGRHAGFDRVTADALDFALAEFAIDDAALRQVLLDAYATVAAFTDVPAVLRELRGQGLLTAILSNGTPAMLASALAHADIAGDLDAVLSVESVGVYKPHPGVYRLPLERFGVSLQEVLFVSSNGWDIVGAATFGLRTVWCNRYGQSPERLTASADAEVQSLQALPALLGLV